MEFLQYTGYTEDGDSQILGLAFIYNDQRLCYSIETELDSKNKQREHEQRDQFEALKTRICQILLAINEGKDYTKVPRKDYMQYCLETTLEFLLKQNDLISAF